MTRTVTIACSCGRRIEVHASVRPAAECPRCGRMAASGAAGEEPSPEAARLTPAAREELGSLLCGLEPEDLACRGCGAVMAVALGDDGRTVAVCQRCGRRFGLSPRRASSATVRRAQ